MPQTILGGVNGTAFIHGVLIITYLVLLSVVFINLLSYSIPSGVMLDRVTRVFC